MANKTFQGRIVQKHDTEANWKKATNFVPLKGELIIYDDLNKIKIGDGNTKINDLKFDTATFYVNVTQGTGNSATADKTAKEIYDAYQAGYAVSAIAKFRGMNFPFILPLAGVQSDDDGYVLGFGALGSLSADASPQYPTVINFYGTWQMWVGNLVRDEDLATIAKTGSYSDLENKRTVNGVTGDVKTTFYVNFTQKSTTGLEAFSYTADKTIQEIKDAYNNGYNIVGKIANASNIGDLNLPLAIINPTENIFYFMGFGDTTSENVGQGFGLCFIVYDNGSWGGLGQTLAFYSDLPNEDDLPTEYTENEITTIYNNIT